MAMMMMIDGLCRCSFTILMMMMMMIRIMRMIDYLASLTRV